MAKYQVKLVKHSYQEVTIDIDSDDEDVISEAALSESDPNGWTDDDTEAYDIEKIEDEE